MPPAIDFTGVWAADDGATYYIRQLSDGSVAWAGLHNSGFHGGMKFTNVFRGRVASDGKTLSGDWADVPRGESNNAGTLSLEIVLQLDGLPPEWQIELRQKPDRTSGGFAARVWRRGPSEPFQPPGPVPLGPHNIEDIQGRVHRYDVPLAENNPPCRDFTVMWGSITEVSWPSLPPERTYCSFINSGGSFPWDWGGDGDFTFDLVPDFSLMKPDFWTADWVATPLDDGSARNELIHLLFDQYEFFHCEVAMYGRENDGDHCADPPITLLPGWQENAGNSVLANGRPINGSFVEVTVRNHRMGAPPPPYKALLLGPETGGKQVNLTPRALARVTGVVAVDAGHPGNPPEIHPVYAIDIVQDFTAKQPHANVNWTGTWHADDVGTYYLRQIENTVWWLGLSHDQGRTFGNVFCGTVAGNVIRGDWADVPIGAGGARSGGSLVLTGNTLASELIKTSQTNFYGGSVWTKLYDT